MEGGGPSGSAILAASVCRPGALMREGSSLQSAVVCKVGSGEKLLVGETAGVPGKRPGEVTERTSYMTTTLSPAYFSWSS